MKRLALAFLIVIALASPSWARVAVGSGGTLATGTTSLSVPYPATVLAGDLMVLCLVNKYPTNSPTTPSGWALPTNGQASGGLGVDTTDTGHVYSTWYTKVADGTETGNLAVTITSGNSSAGRITTYRNSTGVWSTGAANAPVDVALTAWSAAAGTDPGVTAGDIVLTCSGVYTDVVSFTSEALAQNGVTFGTATERVDTAVTDGDDLHILFSDHLVSSGTSSDASLVFTATASGAVGGSTAFLRIREATSSPIVFGSVGTVGSGSTSLTAVAPATVNAGDLLVLCIVNKYPAAPPSTPTDAFGGSWAAVTNGQASGGNDPDAADDGHILSTLYVKTATGTEDGGNVAVTITSGNTSSANIVRYTNTTGAWATAGTNGEDATTDASWSVTGAGDPDVQAGDFVITCSGTANDQTVMTETTEILTQTGVTYGLSSERNDTGSTTGDDIGLKIVGFMAIAGASSNVPTFVATLATANSAGSTAFVRIRENVAAAAPSGTGFFGAILQ